MFTEKISLNSDELDQRIAEATKVLSNKKFNENQLEQFIIHGKFSTKNKSTKNGYQLFMDDYRKKLTIEQRSNIAKVSREGSAEWRVMEAELKFTYLEKAKQLKENHNISSEYQSDNEIKNITNEISEEKNIKKRKKKDDIDNSFWGDLDNIKFIRFIYKIDKSNKFWEYTIDNNKILIRFGKIDSKGTIQQKTFENEEEATKYILRETGLKEKKGYSMDY